jgi:ribosome biogenesis protein BMS1
LTLGPLTHCDDTLTNSEPSPTALPSSLPCPCDSPFGVILLLHLVVTGTPLRGACRVHIPGVGDYNVTDVRALPDPCPPPTRDPTRKRVGRTLTTKETLRYAPMSNVGHVVYDEDAVYIDVPRMVFTPSEKGDAGDGGDEDSGEDEAATAVSMGEGVSMVTSLQKVDESLAEGLEGAELSLLRGGRAFRGHEVASRDSWAARSSEDRRPVAESSSATDTAAAVVPGGGGDAVLWDDEEDEGEDGDGLVKEEPTGIAGGSDVRWKSDLATKAAAAFVARQAVCVCVCV